MRYVAMSLLVLVLWAAVGLGDSPFPIYVTVVMHTEDPPTNPDFTRDREIYLQWRDALVEFAELLHRYGAAFDYQCEWTFPAAAATYDKGDVTANTEGLNVLKYLHDV
ncbi:MAG TPA: hypothetical protein ENF77_03505, partial [Candidatus Acetothermia bacterium]|nr:hypothetical protein [Candidatus Acetothermia bacterium]